MRAEADGQAGVDDAVLARRLEDWFRANARDLPWRTAERDPYRALVSELMLQQTQVSRVIEKYGAFLKRFPTVQSLAAAPLDDVLAAWAGLGYYRRARLLHACAKVIVEDHGGVVPRTVEELVALPGIGRYTAGAIASMVHGQRAAIVDGNVTRVLLRVHNRPEPQAERRTVEWAWERAGQLVEACDSPGVFNEAMMELGATVCTPGNVGCQRCPIRGHCGAFAAGTTESVPLPKPRARQKPLYCASVIVCEGGRIVLQRRPAEGMWADMYQTPTLERPDRAPTAAEAARSLGLKKGDLESKGSFTHMTTHRIVEFTLYAARGVGTIRDEGLLSVPVGDLGSYAMSNAQRKVLTIAGIL